MSSHSFSDLMHHVGHEVEVVTYGREVPVNVAVECVECSEVLLDFDAEELDTGTTLR
jgi:hypothetical protein